MVYNLGGVGLILSVYQASQSIPWVALVVPPATRHSFVSYNGRDSRRKLVASEWATFRAGVRGHCNQRFCHVTPFSEIQKLNYLEWWVSVCCKEKERTRRRLNFTFLGGMRRSRGERKFRESRGKNKMMREMTM